MRFQDLAIGDKFTRYNSTAVCQKTGIGTERYADWRYTSNERQTPDLCEEVKKVETTE